MPDADIGDLGQCTGERGWHIGERERVDSDIANAYASRGLAVRRDIVISLRGFDV